jgi:hypothetical protein
MFGGLEPVSITTGLVAHMFSDATDACLCEKLPEVSSLAMRNSRFQETLRRDLFRSPPCDDVAVSVRFDALARTTFEDSEVGRLV